MSHPHFLREGQILTGARFNEPMRVETVRGGGGGPDTWVAALVGTQSERFRKVTLTSRDLESLAILDTTHSYEGDGRLLRLGLQAYSLGIAYAFDPYFGLSISRVDPLPHQLEAVYDHLLKPARVRFLLADDAGTILLTPNERRAVEDRPDCYWLYVVTGCGTKPEFQEPIQDPARFHRREVTKVAHYYLSVNAMTRPMQVREDEAPYGKRKNEIWRKQYRECEAISKRTV